MGKHPHVGPERFGKRDFEAQSLSLWCLSCSSPANVPVSPVTFFQSHTWSLELFFKEKIKVKLSIKLLHTQRAFSLTLTIYLPLLDLFEPVPSILNILPLQSSKIPQSNLMVYEERLYGMRKIVLSFVSVNHYPP